MYRDFKFYRDWKVSQVQKSFSDQDVRSHLIKDLIGDLVACLSLWFYIGAGTDINIFLCFIFCLPTMLFFLSVFRFLSQNRLIKRNKVG